MGARFGIESVHEMGMPKITIRIVGLSEYLGWDDWIKEPCRVPSDS